MTSGIGQGHNGAAVRDSQEGRVFIAIKGTGELSPKHAREFAEMILSAAARAEKR